MKQNFMRSFLIALILLISISSISVTAGTASTATNVVERSQQLVGRSLQGYTPEDFLTYLFRREGIQLSGTLEQMSRQGSYVSQSSLQRGDVLFYGTDGNHLLGAGIYDGQGHVVIASSKLSKIRSFSVTSSTITPYYLGAVRFTPQVKTNTDSQGETIIQAGLRYLGTPYEYGSNRSTKRTMDCSEFTMWAVKEGVNITLPTTSNRQANYVKSLGHFTSSWQQLQRGDLMFFMDYLGWQLSNYNGVNPAGQRATHVGIYLGDGKILHTYSKESGGVCISSLPGTHWEKRFIFGGSVIPQ